MIGVETLTTKDQSDALGTGNRYRYLDEKGEHVHTLDGQPLVGTSRVGSILAKPLAWYGSGKAVEVFGCQDPKLLTRIKNKKASQDEITQHRIALQLGLDMIQKLDIEGYSTLIDKAYRAHDVYMRSRAKPGKDLHAECEAYIKMCMNGTYVQTFDPKIDPLLEWSRDNVKRFLWSEGHCYSEKHWIGGISDAGYETHEGKFGVLDFKSSKEAHMDQFWQCAGYAIQIEENGVLDANGNKIWPLSPKDRPTGPHHWIDEVCVFPFGGDEPRPYFFVDIQGAKECFLAELFIYNHLPKD